MPVEATQAEGVGSGVSSKEVGSVGPIPSSKNIGGASASTAPDKTAPSAGIGEQHTIASADMPRPSRPTMDPMGAHEGPLVASADMPGPSTHAVDPLGARDEPPAASTGADETSDDV
ncbi:hypothetical protein Q3G72_028492 [Acer saccharum]|nr:hypothetical protein Q3G72_028492 [Acer saccharum]